MAERSMPTGADLVHARVLKDLHHLGDVGVLPELVQELHLGQGIGLLEWSPNQKETQQHVRVQVGSKCGSGEKLADSTIYRLQQPCGIVNHTERYLGLVLRFAMGVESQKVDLLHHILHGRVRGGVGHQVDPTEAAWSQAKRMDGFRSMSVGRTVRRNMQRLRPEKNINPPWPSFLIFLYLNMGRSAHRLGRQVLRGQRVDRGWVAVGASMKGSTQQPGRN